MIGECELKAGQKGAAGGVGASNLLQCSSASMRTRAIVSASVLSVSGGEIEPCNSFFQVFTRLSTDAETVMSGRSKLKSASSHDPDRISCSIAKI